MSIYDTLNPKQKEAVLHTDGPLLILAGAGSGKTRVLTHRIAYLIDECGVNPWNIMAITFTNKAAGEMRERVDDLVGFGAESIWVSTFHSSCVRILRRHIESLGYTTSFSIYDSDDQKTLMRQVFKAMNVDTKQFKERSVLAAISSAKDKLITPEEFLLNAGADFREKKTGEIYKEYQKQLRKNNALDFDDLIVKTVELFQNNPQVLDYYQERFKYIMVDEYQDTNMAQFKLVSLLASKYRNLCVVGDDDQSIYRFRGADIQNILSFEHTFPGTKVIKLEQNYRSTQNILDAANGVIRHNFGRKDKTLWTANGEGDKILFKQFDTARDEADFVARQIRDSSYSYQDQAGEIGGGEEYYKCYYPFLDYSPELAALRTCRDLGIPGNFMDLPYREILAACEKSRSEGLTGDRLLSDGRFFQKLYQKTGLRSFDEFWEKYFEIQGLCMESENWFEMLLGYCRMIREDTPPEQICSEGCEARCGRLHHNHRTLVTSDSFISSFL